METMSRKGGQMFRIKDDTIHTEILKIIIFQSLNLKIKEMIEDKLDTEEDELTNIPFRCMIDPNDHAFNLKFDVSLIGTQLNGINKIKIEDAYGCLNVYIVLDQNKIGYVIKHPLPVFIDKKGVLTFNMNVMEQINQQILKPYETINVELYNDLMNNYKRPLQQLLGILND